MIREDQPQKPEFSPDMPEQGAGYGDTVRGVPLEKFMQTDRSAVGEDLGETHVPTVEFDVDIERFFGAQSITELMNYLEDNKGRQYMVNVGAVGIDTRVTKGFSETADIIQQAISHELNSRDLNNPDPQSLRILLRGLPRLTKEMVRPENSFPDKVFQLIRAASSQELHDLVTR